MSPTAFADEVMTGSNVDSCAIKAATTNGSSALALAYFWMSGQ